MGSVSSSLATKYAFFPPSPPSYALTVDQSTGHVTISGQMGSCHVGLMGSCHVDVLRLPTKRATAVVAVFFKNPAAETTVLYSHGNAADIGHMFRLFTFLSAHLQVNLMGLDIHKLEGIYALTVDESTGHVTIPGLMGTCHVDILRMPTKRATTVVVVFFKNMMVETTVLYYHSNAARTYISAVYFAQCRSHLMGYDYSGYGQSTGKPSEENTYADIEAAYRCLEQKYGIKEENVILYGQSLGSGPTLDLASRLPRLRAVVLHSPILSGLRVMFSINRTYWFDIYKNIDKIQLVKCPVLVIHGTADDIVDCSHGKKLWELCKEKYEPLWVSGGNHCDLETHPEYIIHLKKFIYAIEKSINLRNGSGLITNQIDDTTKSSTDVLEKYRPSTDQRESSRENFDYRKKPRSSSLRIERSRGSIDRREKSRRSIDCGVRSKKKTDHPGKARNSIDRLGDVVRSVGLCSIDCFKPPTGTEK